MTQLSKLSALAFSALLLSSSAAFSQSAVGSGAAGAAGSAGAGSAATSGVPAGPASPGGTGNVVNDPSGQGNAAKLAPPPSPGTNSLGTANSSGGSSTSGTATGSTTPPATGSVNVTGPNTSTTGDAAVDAQDRAVDKKI